MNKSKIEESQPTLQQHFTFSSSFIQSEKTRRPNGLNYKMRNLFNKGKLTQWEYSQYKHFVRAYAKAEGLYYDEIDEQLFECVQS